MDGGKKGHSPMLKKLSDVSDKESKSYPKAALTADIVIFRQYYGVLQVLAIKRKNPPYEGCWGLPGGFLDVTEDESLEACAIRELREETGLSVENVFSLGTYSFKGRDPRDRVVSQLFVSVLVTEGSMISGEGRCTDSENCFPVAGDDAVKAVWMGIVVEQETTMVKNSEVARPSENEVQIKVTLNGDGETAYQSFSHREIRVKLGQNKTCLKYRNGLADQGTLAFDHGEMLFEAYRWLKDYIRYDV